METLRTASCAPLTMDILFYTKWLDKQYLRDTGADLAEFWRGHSPRRGKLYPAIFMLVHLWNRLLEINWKEHLEDGRVEMIEGTNGAIVMSMKNVDAVVELLRHSL